MWGGNGLMVTPSSLSLQNRALNTNSLAVKIQRFTLADTQLTNKVQGQHVEVLCYLLYYSYIQSTEFFLFDFFAENAMLALFASSVTFPLSVYISLNQ